MSLFSAFGWGKHKPIQPDSLEILFHTAAAYFGEHGRILATNRSQGIIEKPVIFSIKGVTTPLPMNLRLFFHIWDSAKAEGFIPHELLSYGTIIAPTEIEGLSDGQRQMIHLAFANGVSPQEANDAMVAARHLALNQSTDRGSMFAAALGRPVAVAEKSDTSVDIPTHLRKNAGNTEPGFKSSGFDSAGQGPGTAH